MEQLIDGNPVSETEALNHLECGGDVIFQNYMGSVLIQYFCHAFELIVNGEVINTYQRETITEAAEVALREAPEALFGGEAEVDSLLVPFQFNSSGQEDSREKIRKALELYARFNRVAQETKHGGIYSTELMRLCKLQRETLTPPEKEKMP